MPKDAIELKRGSWIVHATHGLGQIKGLDTKEVMGERKQYFTVKTDLITYWLPVEDVDWERIRPMAQAASFEEAIELISSLPNNLDQNFRRRLIHIKNHINDGSLKSKACLIRDMHARDVQMDIHVNEKKILDNLQRQFLAEWSESTGIDDQTARQRLDEALNKSCSNISPKKHIF